ncbi:MAG: lysylphosphatidylglycerol synthase transmembrane domain-containing protein [Candidatus Methanoperedens sp.]
MKTLRIILQVIIGIALIAFILKKLNFDEVVSVLKKTNLLFFILACLAYLGLNIVLSTRLFYLLKKIGYDIKYPAVLLSHMGGMVVGDITPGRGGYFLTPSILKKNAGVRITDGMACIFAPQGMEFILKVGGAITAVFYISTISSISENLLISMSIGAVLILMAGISMLVISWHDENLTSKFIRKLPFFNKFTENLSSFKEHNIKVKGSIKTILALYLIGWVLAAFQWFYLGKAIGIELSFFTFFLLHPLITILMFVPVSPAGLGLMEGGVIVVFSLFGIPSAMGLAFSVLVRFSIFLVDLIGLKTVFSATK